MFYLQLVQSSVTARISADQLVVPKFTLEDVANWAQKILEARLAKITHGMDEVKRREYLTYYPQVPPDIAEMKKHLRTPVGVKQVIRACLPHAKRTNAKTGAALPNLTQDEVEKLIVANGTGRLAGLAWALADLDEQMALEPTDDPDEKDVGGDPLSSSAGNSSNPESGGGSKTSQSSTQPTTDSTPVA